MKLSVIERKLKFSFPASHRKAILDLTDPIHRACDFLIVSENQYADLGLFNELLRNFSPGNPWPEFLIAFASNGCGDYFAYDTRQNPTSIIYIDPDKTVEENLCATDQRRYDTFEEWYKLRIAGWHVTEKKVTAIVKQY